jgi:hypothetical protein
LIDYNTLYNTAGGERVTEEGLAAHGAYSDGSDDELHELLRRRLSRLNEQREDLLRRRRELDDSLNKIEEERGHIAALLGLKEADSTPVSLAVDDEGENPADLVVRLLHETGPLHYREIERQLRSRGWYRAGGVDPANTLLSKYFQDPRLYRPRRGVYAIRPEGSTVQSVGTRRKRVRRQGRASAKGM